VELQRELVGRTLVIQKSLARWPAAILARQNGSLVAVPCEAMAISEMPRPRFELCELEQYKQPVGGDRTLVLPYQTRRGCANSCAFCTHRVMHGVEAKPARTLARELAETVAVTGATHFFFCDSSLNSSKVALQELCTAIGGLKLKWGAFARVNTLDEPGIEAMSRAGARFLFLGVESGSDDVLRRMNKRATAEHCERVIRACHWNGIAILASFIVGFPGETEEDVDATTDFIRRNGRYIQEAGATALMLDLGSGLHAQPKQYALRSLRCDLAAIARHRSVFTYSDAEGASWERIQRRNGRALRRVQKAIYRHVTRKAYNGGVLSVLPFFVYRYLLKYEYDRGSALGRTIYLLKKLLAGRSEQHASFVRIFELRERLCAQRE